MEGDMYLGRTISALLALTDKTQTELAKGTDLRHATINSIINAGTRPHPANLGAICSWWTDHTHGTECLIAHLRDEIQRCGMQQDRVKIAATDGTAPDTISALTAAYDSDPLVRDLLDDLAALVHREELPTATEIREVRASGDPRIAADPPDQYETPAKARVSGRKK
jgi:hypothetical protein